MARYAEGTKVGVEASEAEIKRALARFGATSIISGDDGDRTFVLFRARDRFVKFVIPKPALDDFRQTPTGRSRDTAGAADMQRQELRRRWRALALLVKAKLTAIEEGIVTFEDEFLADTVMENGQRFSEVAQPALAEAYRIGGPPVLRLTDQRLN